MNVLHIILTVIQVLCAVGLVAVVMLQSGKDGGLGAITGSSEGFLSKNKSGSRDALLAKVTKIIAAVFLILTFVLNLF